MDDNDGGDMTVVSLALNLKDRPRGLSLVTRLHLPRL